MNENLKKNIHRLYLAQYITLVCSFLLIIPLVNFAAAIAALVGGIIGIIGLVSLRHEHPDYMNAVYFWLIGIVVNLITNNAGDGVISSFMDLLTAALSMGMVFFVIRATDSFLLPLGREDVVEKGRKAWKDRKLQLLISVAMTLLALLMPAFLIVFMIVELIVMLRAALSYIGYLKAAEEAV